MMNIEDTATEASQVEYEKDASLMLIDWAVLPHFTGEGGLACGHREEAVAPGGASCTPQGWAAAACAMLGVPGPACATSSPSCSAGTGTTAGVCVANIEYSPQLSTFLFRLQMIIPVSKGH